MSAIGKVIKHGGKEGLSMLMAMFTRVIGFLTKPMEKEFMST